jgi:hypothetical protein
MAKYGLSLNTIIENTDNIRCIKKGSLGIFDYLLVKTINSQYTIKKVDSRFYEISGGWFDKNGKSPTKMIIRGCTWGGSSIYINMLAACGLRLEFGNNVITSPVNQIIVIRGNYLN